jgi:hypothetical protein
MHLYRLSNISVFALFAALACRADVANVTAPRTQALRASSSAAGVTTTRPVTDFTDAQSALVGWTAPQQTTGARGDNLFMLMDYTGLRNRQIIAGGGADLGTTISGSITERALADGTAEVHVIVHADNAFAIGRDLITNVILFGHAVPQIVGGADAALGQCDFELTFINSAPGAPMPDLATTAVTFKSLFFRGNADGTLRAAFGVPDGTPGHGHVVQNGLFNASGQGATADGFPAELITFKVVGN